MTTSDPQIFNGPVVFNGPVTVNTPYIDFYRPDIHTGSGIRWFRSDEPLLPNGQAHYFELGMDWAVGGYYFAGYDNSIDIDFLQLGVDGPACGRIAIGHDPIDPFVALSIHDQPGITASIKTWSNGTSLFANSKALDADLVVINRDGTSLGHWLNFHQGDGSHDTRIGMLKDSYSVNFALAAQVEALTARVQKLEILLARQNAQ